MLAFRNLSKAKTTPQLFMYSRMAFATYDVAVIGGGPGGYVAAIKAG